MANTPDVAGIAGLIGDRARATILMALMAGRALTATELARSANVSKQTASSHLSKLLDAGLVTAENAGRHRYFRLANHDVGTAIESLMGLAQRLGAVHVESGPADPAMRKARVCYDHLAGDMGVLVFDNLKERRHLRMTSDGPALTESGRVFCEGLGVDLAALERRRRPLCLSCLDWSVRRHHLAGALGAALLSRFTTLGWARQEKGSRTVVFSVIGERELRAAFGGR